MERRRSIVRINANLFHNINLATFRPRICYEIIVARHHPESRPCALTFRQFDASFEDTVKPALGFVSIYATRINLAVAALETVDIKPVICNFCYTLTISRAVRIILKFIIHPARLLHLMTPIGTIQLRAFIKLIIPDQFVPLRNHHFAPFNRSDLFSSLMHWYRYLLIL